MKPGATEALKTFWALDLDSPHKGWREPPWPGPAREQAVVATVGDTFYLISGDELEAGPLGKPVLKYLRDAYAYTPARGWRRLADLPRATETALSPAPVTPGGRLLVISGDDGTRVHLDGPDHPGFPRDIFAYDTAADRWEIVGEAPVLIANVPSATWRGNWIAVCRRCSVSGCQHCGTA